MRQPPGRNSRTVTVSRRRKDIQGLRAVAVIFVVYYHAGLPLGGGFIGVDVFFVISGFVITAMLLREFSATGGIALGAFYARRFRRLTPALSAVIVFVLIGSGLILSPLGTQNSVILTAIGALGLFANVLIARTTGGYFDAAAATNPLLHTWTLSLEEQFYLVFPFVLLLGWWLARRSRRGSWIAVAVVIVFGAVSFVIALLTSGTEPALSVSTGAAGFYGPLGRAWEFAAGAALALAVGKLRTPSARASAVFSTAGFAILVVCFATFSGDITFPGLATLVPVSATLMLLYAGLNASTLPSRMLSSPPLVAVGDFSYSWYLWHWPFIVFAAQLFPDQPIALPVAALLSAIPAMLSYRWLERPISRMKAPRRRTMLVIVAVTVAVPVIIAGALGVAVKQSYWSPRVQGFQESQQLHAGELAGCMSRVALTEATAPSCLWNGDADGVPVYLVGDSIADHYSEGLIVATRNMGHPLTMSTAAACTPYHLNVPAIGTFAPRDLAAGAGCAEYVDGTLEWLDAQPAGLVILASNDVVGWNPSEVIPTIPAFDFPAYLKTNAITEGLTATTERMQAAGHTVMIAKAPPSYRFPEPGWSKLGCNTATIIAGDCIATASIADMDDLQGPTRDIIDAVALDTGAAILDFRDYFCPAGTCSTQHGDITLYLDDIHISVTASANLAPQFEVALESAIAANGDQ